MDPTRLKRDASKVHAALRTTADKAVVALKPIKIYIPERFLEKNLASVGVVTSIAGIFAIVVDDTHYGVSTTNAIFQITPSATATVKLDGETYLEFSFEPGSTVFKSTDLLRNDVLVYYIFDMFISKGRVPWYLNYYDLLELFNTADRFAGVGLTASHSILEMIVSAIARDPKDRTRYYRHGVKSSQDVAANPPAIVPLRSIGLGATNTTAKLMGAYWNDGLTSALVNPSDRVENIEELLRR